jgi:hypothetical protein
MTEQYQLLKSNEDINGDCPKTCSVLDFSGVHISASNSWQAT